MTIKHFIIQQMHKYIIIKYLKVLRHVSDHKGSIIIVRISAQKHSVEQNTTSVENTHRDE